MREMLSPPLIVFHLPFLCLSPLYTASCFLFKMFSIPFFCLLSFLSLPLLLSSWGYVESAGSSRSWAAVYDPLWHGGVHCVQGKFWCTFLLPSCVLIKHTHSLKADPQDRRSLRALVVIKRLFYCPALFLFGHLTSRWRACSREVTTAWVKKKHADLARWEDLLGY